MSDSGIRRLDPDALASMEAERDFLLRSLDDLEAELAAGDIDQLDYEELKDDYTRRTADVLRVIAEERESFDVAPRIGWGRVGVWVVGLALLGALSGVLIARSSGERSSGDSITGGVRESVVGRLEEAQNLFSDQTRWEEAVGIYDEVLQEQPDNVEALTNRAWLQYRLGEPVEPSLEAWAKVESLDSSYPDAIVFWVIALGDEGRYIEAAAEFDRLDLATSSPIIGSIVAERGLRGEVYGEARFDQIASEQTPSLATLGLDSEVALEAANYLLTTGRDGSTVAVLKLYSAVLGVEPENTAALSRQALLFAQTGDPVSVERARELVDRAVASNPDDIEARLSRATILSATGLTGLAADDLDVVCSDLAKAESLAASFEDLPPGLTAQLEALSGRLRC